MPRNLSVEFHILMHVTPWQCHSNFQSPLGNCAQTHSTIKKLYLTSELSLVHQIFGLNVKIKSHLGNIYLFL